MAKTMLLLLATGKRFNKFAFLFRSDRAYLVNKKFGFDLLDCEDNDLPKFRQIRESKLPEDIPIIDLTEGISNAKEKKPKKKVKKSKKIKKLKVLEEDTIKEDSKEDIEEI